jgi:hypothetical protein
MEHGGQVLGPASTRFNDYTGTVAADDAEAIKDRPSLYELAMIDRDRFTIVGIDLNVDDPITATVYAVDRAEQAARESVGTAELGKAGGEIPVFPFDIPEPKVEDFMRHAFGRISFRLVRQDLGDHSLVVVKGHPSNHL